MTKAQLIEISIDALIESYDRIRDELDNATEQNQDWHVEREYKLAGIKQAISLHVATLTDLVANPQQA